MLRIEASKTHLCKHTKMRLMNILSLFQISAPLEHPCFTCHVNVCMCVFLSAPQTLFTNMWGAVLHSDYDSHKILIARTACRVTINRFMICYHMWYDMIWCEMMMIWFDNIWDLEAARPKPSLQDGTIHRRGPIWSTQMLWILIL